MDTLIRLGLLAVSGAAADRARRAAAELASQAAALLVSALLAGYALGCAAAALWLLVAPSLGAVGAWLVTAATLAAASIAVLLGLWLWRARRGRRIHQPPVANELANWLGDHEWTLIAASLLAGFLSARRRQR